MGQYISIADKNDNEIGQATKLEAIQKGLIRRVARIFIVNSKGKILLTKRTDNRLLLPGAWDQSSAGHVDPGETYEQAAYRELKEELGISGVSLRFLGHYYLENEIGGDHYRVFNSAYVGIYNTVPLLDIREFSKYKWLTVKEIEMMQKKEKFGYSFKPTFKLLKGYLKLNLQK
jgi:16S rRNA (adenine1518-N6/adenine1519-N6)-dimethyltransferase